MTSFVLDSLPILVYLRQQQGWERVKALFDECRRQGTRLPISAINLGEVFYISARHLGKDRASQIVETLSATVLEVDLPSLRTITNAAELKIHGGISYADCFAAALALEHGLPILTSDREFERLVSRGLQIAWLE